MRYFARVTAGLEQVAWQEIEQCAGAKLLGFGHRRIDFTYEGPPASLLRLKSVDDVYIFVTRLHGFDRTRASLAVFQQLREVDFSPALNTVSAVRGLANPPTYGVTASYLGRRNYSRYDIEAAVQKALSEHAFWCVMPRRSEDHASHDLDLRVLIEDDWALVGLRLNRTPLHRRPYKIASRPGSLKAPVAYCLCMIADLKPEDRLLDPTCGAGTILIEAAKFVTRGVLVGIDIDADAIVAARQNSEAAGLQAQAVKNALALHVDGVEKKNDRSPIVLLKEDARDVLLPEASFQVVITNLPWGKQVGPATDLFALYAGILKLADKSLDSTGRAVILTDRVDILQTALKQFPRLTLASSFQISLFGSHPTVHLIFRS